VGLAELSKIGACLDHLFSSNFSISGGVYHEAKTELMERDWKKGCDAGKLRGGVCRAWFIRGCLFCETRLARKRSERHVERV